VLEVEARDGRPGGHADFFAAPAARLAGMASESSDARMPRNVSMRTSV